MTTEDIPPDSPAGKLIAAGGWCQPSGLTYEFANHPDWYYSLCALANQFNKRAKKIEKKERKVMPQYRSHGKIKALRGCAAQLDELADKLAKENPVGSVNKSVSLMHESLPDVVIMGRGGIRFADLTGGLDFTFTEDTP